jgi:hypothetical protein
VRHLHRSPIGDFKDYHANDNRELEPFRVVSREPRGDRGLNSGLKEMLKETDFLRDSSKL